MIENKRILCRFLYLDNAIFWPSKIKLVLGIALSAIEICKTVFDAGGRSKSCENNNQGKNKWPKLNSFLGSFDNPCILISFWQFVHRRSSIVPLTGLDYGGPFKTIPEETSLRDVSVDSGMMPNYFSLLLKAARHPYFLKSKCELHRCWRRNVLVKLSHQHHCHLSYAHSKFMARMNFNSHCFLIFKL